MFLKNNKREEEEEEEEEGRAALASPLKLALIANKVLDKFIIFRPLIGTLYQKALKVYIDLINNWVFAPLGVNGIVRRSGPEPS
jgi:FMN-dependent NADH-azoreductase